MNFEFLKTPHGFINLLQVCFGFAALFASSFIWNDSNVYFQFIYNHFGWQTLILFILFVTWIFALLIFVSNLFERDVLGTIGKFKLLILYSICLVILIISAGLETWYIGLSKGFLHTRFIVVTRLLALSILLLISIHDAARSGLKDYVLNISSFFNMQCLFSIGCWWGVMLRILSSHYSSFKVQTGRHLNLISRIFSINHL